MTLLFSEPCAAPPDENDKRAKRYDSPRYVDYSWEDETSSFDPQGQWQGGAEYYSRTYRCRVPKKMLELAEKTGDYCTLNNWIEAHEGPSGIWR